MSKKKEIELGLGFMGIVDSKADLDLYGLDTTVDFEQTAYVKEASQSDGVAEKNAAADSEVSSAPQGEWQPVIVDDPELLTAFIQECRDHLENIEEKLLTLETDYDGATVDEIFRSMHTMKGTSAFFGFDKIKELSHRLESLLDSLRQGLVEADSQMIDVLLGGTDILNKLILHIDSAANAANPGAGVIEIPDSGIDIDPVVRAIDSLNSGEKPPDAEQPVCDLPPQAEELITGEMREKFAGEVGELLDAIENNLIRLEDEPESSELLDDTFRCVHTIKGNSGFLGYEELEKISMSMETVLDTIRTGSKAATTKVISRLLSVVDAMQSQLSMLGADGAHNEQDPAGTAASRPIGELLVEMGEITQDALDEALDKQDRKIGEILVSDGLVKEDMVKKALAVQGKSDAAAQSDDAGRMAQRKDIRVDMEKLDKLFELTGELITAELMVLQHPALKDLDLSGFDSAASYLSKITRQMQEITMTVRMIPLEGLFNKMRRLVRDLSRRFEKKVLMEITGQETEMDRNVMEQIADPLVHIMRNAVDHGIEDAETRLQKGKDEAGRLFLSAKYEGNEIWITIKEDGAGLDRERIIAKAGERGMLKGDEENRSDEDIWKLIFEPGFSTAAQLSDVSGRGVGMDVVRRNVEKLKGKISVVSKAGEGTEITLKIPLTLAIMDGITVKVGNCNYAMPLGDILEFHKASANQVVHTDSRHAVLRLREELMPIIKLYEFYGTSTEKGDATDGILIITNANGRKAAVLVDDIIGYQQIVVKSLPGYIGAMRAVSGCSVMGEGEVCLIIDMGSLLKEELEEGRVLENTR